MMIKVFNFEVCNASTSLFDEVDRKKPWWSEENKKIVSTEEIERVVNDYINSDSHYTLTLVDIKVNTVDVHQHNNGGSNKVWLVYTIIFK